MSNFKECVVIPLATLKKCKCIFKEEIQQLPAVSSPPPKLLFDESLPADTRLKLFHKEKLTKNVERENLEAPKVRVVETPTKEPERAIDSEMETILTFFSEKTRPIAEHLLNVIRKNKDILFWDGNLRLTVYDRTIPNTSIVKLLQYCLGDIVITRESDRPYYSQQFVDLLLSVGVPTAILSLPRKHSTRASKRRAVDWEPF